MIERLTDPKILERIPIAGDVSVEQLVARLIHANENHAIFGAFENFDIGGVAKTRKIPGRRVKDEVDVAGQQGRDPGRIIRNRRKDNVLHIAFKFSPPCRVALVDGFDARCARYQHVGTSPVGIE